MMMEEVRGKIERGEEVPDSHRLAIKCEDIMDKHLNALREELKAEGIDGDEKVEYAVLMITGHEDFDNTVSSSSFQIGTPALLMSLGNMLRNVGTNPTMMLAAFSRNAKIAAEGKDSPDCAGCDAEDCDERETEMEVSNGKE